MKELHFMPLSNYRYMTRPKKRVPVEMVGGYVDPWYFDMIIKGTDKIPERTFILYDGEGQIAYQEEVPYGDATLYVPFAHVMPFYLATLTPPPVEADDKDRWKAIREFVYKHWDYPDEDIYDVITAFIHATWLPEQWTARPYFAALGDSGVGKTRLMDVFGLLVYRADRETTLGDANLYRGLEMYKPTMILDETEYMTNDDKQTLINILNSSQKDGTYVKRLKTQAEEGVWGFDWFQLKAFIILAGTRIWHETLQRRSIIVYPQENTRPVLKKVDVQGGRQLRANLLAWRMKYVAHPPFKTEEIDKICDDADISGTTYELFFPLIAVTPPEFRQVIIDYAKRHGKRAKENRSISDNATVFYVMLQVAEFARLIGTTKFLLIAEIDTELNKDTSDKNKFHRKTIAAIIRTMGFTVKHTQHGVGVVWNEPLVERLKKMYGALETKTEAGKTEATEKPKENWFEGSKQ